MSQLRCARYSSSPCTLRTIMFTVALFIEMLS
jgi:hypothetical protein